MTCSWPTMNFNSPTVPIFGRAFIDSSTRAAADGQQHVCPKRLIRRLNREHVIDGLNRFVEVPLEDWLRLHVQAGLANDLSKLLPHWRLTMLRVWVIRRNAHRVDM